ncbi:MAG TPA: polyprenyl synthetase family protein [Ktedonobacterales bacterium]|nr:polyprenyl synthetase family protein [Ktedonobacterales bacterium]
MVAIKDGTGIFSPLSDDRERIAQRLDEHSRETIGENAGLLTMAVNHAVASRGKYIRSLLLLDACRAVGGNPDTIFPAAMSAEYGHLASLIHDDIMDGDTERRGQETVHHRYGRDAAVLAGDTFIFMAFLGYVECHDQGADAERTLEAIRTLSLTCIAMCRGQALEAGIVGRPDTTEETYFEVVRQKTSAFTRAVCEIGALLGGGDDAAVGALGAFGDNLGVAFQVVDDVLCYDQVGSGLGKSTLSDLRNRRVTLPVIYALQAANTWQHDRIHALFESQCDDEGSLRKQHAELTEIIQATGALERARAASQAYTQLARANLNLLAPSDARERLAALVTLLAVRDR